MSRNEGQNPAEAAGKAVQELLPTFVESGREQVEHINDALLRWQGEGPAGRRTVLEEIARNAHSLKGAAMAMGMAEFAGLCHRMEDVIRGVQQGSDAPEEPALSRLFRAADALDGALSRLAAASQDAAGIKQAEEGLQDVLSNAPPGSPPSVSETPASGTAVSWSGLQDTVRLPTRQLDRFLNTAVELVISRNRMQTFADDLRDLCARQEAERKILDQLLSLSSDDAVDSHRVRSLARDALEAGRDRGDALESFQDRFRDALDDLSKLVTETQQVVMGVRMLPVSLLFARLPGALRDLSHRSGKQIRLVVEGRETRIDKRAIEELGDPLMHLLRNAVDHGIEPEAQRRKAGKPAEGSIAVRAVQEADTVVVEIADDGRGIDPEAVRRKAVEKDLVSREVAQEMVDRELFDLLFRAGFSTSPMITEVSGRGVGMDVVKRNVEQLNGLVELTSRQGHGTRVRITLPLTLATARVFLVRCEDHLLAVPVGAGIQVIREDRKGIHSIQGRKAVYRQGEIIPAVRLCAVLGFPGEGSREIEQDRPIFILLRHGAQKMAFQVDDICGVEEIVIKTLGTHLRRVPNVSGAAVLGTGEVALLVDVGRLFAAAQTIAGPDAPPASAEETKPPGPPRILLAEDQMTTRLLEKSILEAAGFEVTAVADGLAALEELAGAPFDLVITDVQMPRMDGLTLTERLKKDPRYEGIPVMIMTSLEQEADRRKGLNAGADAYMLKSSFDQAALMETIGRLVGRMPEQDNRSIPASKGLGKK